MLRLTALCLLLAPLAACDPMLTPDSSDGLRPVLYGTLESATLERVPEDSHLSVAWLYGSGLMLGSFWRSPMELLREPGGFPSHFALELSPANEIGGVMNAPDDPLGSAGTLGHLLLGKDGTSIHRADDANILGVAEGHMVVLLERDVAAGSREARLLGGALARGYHLMRVVRKSPSEVEAIRACRSAAPDLAARELCGQPWDTLTPESSFTVPVPVRVSDEVHSLRFPDVDGRYQSGSGS